MPEATAHLITVEVAYALPESQTLLTLAVAPGTTAITAVLQSGILEQCQIPQTEPLSIGIFGKKVSHDQPLQAMDRVEIYRPLIVNAKEARRQRVAKQKKLATKRTHTG